MATPVSDAPSRGLSPSLETPARTIRVLLIEDNASDAQLVRSTVVDLRDKELFGPVFAISSATRLSEAFACLVHQDFDIILLDLSLPDSKDLDDTFTRIRRACRVFQ